MWKIHEEENTHHTYLLFLKSMDFLKVGMFKWGLFHVSLKMLYEKRPAAQMPLKERSFFRYKGKETLPGRSISAAYRQSKIECFLLMETAAYG